VLQVAHQPGVIAIVVVVPFQPTYLGLPPRGVDGEPHDVVHGDLPAPVTPLEVGREPRQLVIRRASRALR
jgi:hypothetical protein